VQAVVRLQQQSVTGSTGSSDDQKIRRAIIDIVKRGKLINGVSYPYSPTAAGADNARVLLHDALVAASAATAPRQWIPGDLEAAVESSIKVLKKEGILVSRNMKELMRHPGSFRKAKGLQINDQLLTSDDINTSAAAATSDASAVEPQGAVEGDGQLVNS
jgi:hypothetical protein